MAIDPRTMQLLMGSLPQNYGMSGSSFAPVELMPAWNPSSYSTGGSLPSSYSPGVVRPPSYLPPPVDLSAAAPVAEPQRRGRGFWRTPSRPGYQNDASRSLPSSGVYGSSGGYGGGSDYLPSNYDPPAGGGGYGGYGGGTTSSGGGSGGGSTSSGVGYGGGSMPGGSTSYAPSPGYDPGPGTSSWGVSPGQSYNAPPDRTDSWGPFDPSGLMMGPNAPVENIVAGPQQPGDWMGGFPDNSSFPGMVNPGSLIDPYGDKEETAYSGPQIGSWNDGWGQNVSGQMPGNYGSMPGVGSFGPGMPGYGGLNYDVMPGMPLSDQFIDNYNDPNTSQNSFGQLGSFASTPSFTGYTGLPIGLVSDSILGGYSPTYNDPDAPALNSNDTGPLGGLLGDTLGDNYGGYGGYGGYGDSYGGYGGSTDSDSEGAGSYGGTSLGGSTDSDSEGAGSYGGTSLGGSTDSDSEGAGSYGGTSLGGSTDSDSEGAGANGGTSLGGLTDSDSEGPSDDEGDDEGDDDEGDDDDGGDDDGGDDDGGDDDGGDYATGGPIGKVGKKGKARDIRAHEGEYVIRPESAGLLGRKTLDAMNAIYKSKNPRRELKGLLDQPLARRR